MSEAERRFHEEWLGMVQPVDGLVVSLPVLVDAQCMHRLPPEMQHRLRDLCPKVGLLGSKELETPAIADHEVFFAELLGLRPEDFDTGAAVPEALSLYVPEGRQTVRPTAGLRRESGSSSGSAMVRREQPSTAQVTADDAADSPAVRAGRNYVALIWDLAAETTGHTGDPGSRAGWGLPLDKPETTTGEWHYPPTAKFERLLRHVRVPIGILTNRTHVRLIYAPHGESTGSITFPIADMASSGGRPILDAFVMLLSSARWFSVAAEHQLPALLEQSRRRQSEVTNALADQVFESLEILLAGFEAAADRDGWSQIDEALARNHGHVYGGLLTAVLRTVFLLYAEDRGLLPIEHPLYAEHYSVLGLFERLQVDAAAYPDSMSRRFGAWSQLLAIGRAVFLGVQHGEFVLPPRHGQLFDPNAYPFLEGWDPHGSAPIQEASARAATRVPSIDDGTVHAVLERLLYLDRQRLSYRALDVEQIGSVYEALIGYRVAKLEHRAVGLRPQQAKRVWVTGHEVTQIPKAQRAKWLKDEVGLTKAVADKVAQTLQTVTREDDVLEALASIRNRGTEIRAQGRLVIQPGAERKRSSTHYTPRTLTEPVVRRTLEPLLAVLGPEATADEILKLKICDPAMGTGAFLVEVCRFLGDQVVAAWIRDGEIEKIGDRFEDPVMHARRLVAQRCVYGVDKNPFAVHLAKLSLWLATLAKDLPFTFLDHSLKYGDSLVGLSFKQIEAFHWKPEPDGQLELFDEPLRIALEEALVPRLRIAELASEETAAAQREKERLAKVANDAIEEAILIADTLVGAFFSSAKDKDRERERLRRKDLVQEWLQLDKLEGTARVKQAERYWAVGSELRQMQKALREQQPTFHWMIEFPEIFVLDRPDPLDGWTKDGEAYVDAFVGNPPFLGGSAVSGSFGDEYLAWLKTVHPGSHGNADLSAHFFRRAETLLGTHGTVGLVATNTIGQGDTRSTGLQYLLTQRNCEIYDTTRNMPWPAPGAAVTVSVVHVARGTAIVAAGGCQIADPDPDAPADASRCLTRRAEAINSRLRPKPERPDPEPLSGNAGLSFLGTKIYGQGFTLTPEERDVLVRKDRKNAQRIFPYLGGEEVNTNPDQGFDRYVIDFGQMELQEAERWPDLIEIVRTKVKPERDKNNRETRQKYWWRFGETTPALYAAIRGLPRCLVTARVTKHLCFSFQPTDRILNEKLYCFPLPIYSAFASLQSRVHERWTRLLSSTLKTDLNYSATDCFENFPFPQSDPRTLIPELESIGERLYNLRAQFMLDTQQGLTKTYNLLKDRACDDRRIVDLRNLHLDIDRAVLGAYGWESIAVPPYTTPTTSSERAVFETFEDEILDRLFALNLERATAPAKTVETATTPSRKRKSAPSAEPTSTPELPAPRAPRVAPERKRRAANTEASAASSTRPKGKRSA